MWAVTVAMLAVAAYFLFATRNVPVATPWGFRGYSAIMALPFVTVGAVVAARRPRNPIGWLMCGVGLISAVQMVAEEYAVYATARSGSTWATDMAEWTGHWLWLPAAALVAIAFLRFPNGTLFSRRWRWVGWVAVAGALAGAGGYIVGTPADFDLSGTNPLAIAGLREAASIVAFAGLGLILLGLVAAAASMIVRARRSTGDERLQLKWLVLAAALVPISNLLASLPLPEFVQNVAVCGLAGFPIAMGVAVLKYRLYEIDRVINRTLVYGGLTAILAATYLGLCSSSSSCYRMSPKAPTSRSPDRPWPWRRCSARCARQSSTSSMPASTAGNTTRSGPWRASRRTCGTRSTSTLSHHGC